MSWMRNFASSIFIHISLVVALIFSMSPKIYQPETSKIVLLQIEASSGIGTVANSQAKRNGHRITLRQLRPSYLDNLGKPETTQDEINNQQLPYGDAQSLISRTLKRDSKSQAGIDSLVENINTELSFPDMLIENGIRGTSVLNLYFDSDGFVNERMTSVSGDNFYVRGLIVKAVRNGLVSWFRSTAYTRKVLSNFHFRAVFEFLDVLDSNPHNALSGVTQTGDSSYSFLRRVARGTVSNCAVQSFTNFLCFPMLISGAISRATSDKYKIRFSALKEQLSYFDDIILRGINPLLREARDDVS